MSRLRSLLGSIKRLPATDRELRVLLRDHRQLVEQVRRDQQRLEDAEHALRHAAAQVQGVQEAVDRLHATISEADPQMAYDIVLAVRDDVRTLLVQLTEQANATSGALRETPVQG